VIRALIFDLCDTVVRTAGVQALLHLPGLEAGHDVDSLDAWFKDNPLFYAFERGEIDAQAFVANMRQGPWSGASEPELTAALRQLILHEIDGVPQWLARLKRRWPLYALSNNNPLLWNGILAVSPAVLSFDAVFLSQDTGRLKPEEEAYTYTLERIGCRPQEVIFIDDNPVCVEAAHRLGLGAVRFTTATETAAQVDRMLEKEA
jgi:glucose-1-phosphatase